MVSKPLVSLLYFLIYKVYFKGEELTDISSKPCSGINVPSHHPVPTGVLGLEISVSPCESLHRLENFQSVPLAVSPAWIPFF